MAGTHWRSKFLQELVQAERAREAGNEGMARVCARRAAAVLVREYYSSQGLAIAKRSGLAALRHLAVDQDVDAGIRELASHFTMAINLDHELPPGIDLLVEVQLLDKALFGDPGEHETRAATRHPG